MTSNPECPFYGTSLVFLERQEDFRATPFKMFDNNPFLVMTDGNRCGLIDTAHAPCVMEIDGQKVNWQACSRNPVNNGSYVALGYRRPQ